MSISAIILQGNLMPSTNVHLDYHIIQVFKLFFQHTVFTFCTFFPHLLAWYGFIQRC